MERAFEVYEEALEMLPEKWEDLNEKEKLRAIGIAYKLGEMASKMKGKEKEEEGYLAWAVEALLKDNNTGENREGLIGPGRKEHNKDDNDNRAMKQLKLPDWANKVDVAAPFEALASFYARTGRLEYAPSKPTLVPLNIYQFTITSGMRWYCIFMQFQSWSLPRPNPPRWKIVVEVRYLCPRLHSLLIRMFTFRCPTYDCPLRPNHAQS